MLQTLQCYSLAQVILGKSLNIATSEQQTSPQTFRNTPLINALGCAKESWTKKIFCIMPSLLG